MFWANVKISTVTSLLALLLVISWIVTSAAAAAVDQSEQDAILRGAYFGQDPPGLVPEVFAPGIVSTAAGEGCIVFSADGKRIVLRRFGSAHLILEGRETESGWRIMSVPPPFARLDWYSGDFTLAPDGRSFYFSSTRPLDEAGTELEYTNLWIADWGDSGWSRPIPLPEPIRSPSDQGYPTTAANGTLYFFSREPGSTDGDIYAARQIDGEYGEPRNLGSPVNTTYHEVDPYVPADGSYMIFMSYLRPGGYGGGDLYISFKEEDSSWSEPINMGERINSSADENRPFVTLDGRFFFFTSDRVTNSAHLEELRPDLRPGNGSRDVYWVDARVIERLRPSRESLKNPKR